MRRRFLVSLIGVALVSVLGVVGNAAAGNRPQLGLDLQGGASVVLEPVGDYDSDAVDQSIEIIRSRVDALGVAEPEITRQGDAIVVQLPGVKDQRRALDIVGDTAELRFRPVLEFLPPDGEAPPTTPPATEEPDGEESTTTSADVTSDTADDAAEDTARGQAEPPAEGEGDPEPPGEGEAETGDDPAAEETTTTTTAPAETTDREENDPDAVVILPGRSEDGEPPPRYRLGPATVTGEALSTAQALFNEQNGEWTVNVEFTGEGIRQFNALAAECFATGPQCPPAGIDPNTGQPRGAVAIELDGVVQSAPTIQAPEFQRDQVQISGSFTQGDARDLALVLRFGALPVQLEPQTVQTVSATLGRDSLRAGLIAGGIGVALVALYMIAYYRLLGLVAILTLGVAGMLLWAIIAYLGETQGLALTLAGITGIIVSIGVAVDSNVVFYERLKEEARNGKTLRSTVERSFAGAFSTIVKADVASLIGAALLYWLTVGPVRGFAFFLGLSVLLDIVAAYFFLRPAVILLARSPRFGRPGLLGLPPERVPDGLQGAPA